MTEAAAAAIAVLQPLTKRPRLDDDFPSCGVAVSTRIFGIPTDANASDHRRRPVLRPAIAARCGGSMTLNPHCSDRIVKRTCAIV